MQEGTPGNLRALVILFDRIFAPSRRPLKLRARCMSIPTASRIFGHPFLETRRAVDMDENPTSREATFEPYQLRLGLWALLPPKSKTPWMWIEILPQPLEKGRERATAFASPPRADLAERKAGRLRPRPRREGPAAHRPRRPATSGGSCGPYPPGGNPSYRRSLERAGPTTAQPASAAAGAAPRSCGRALVLIPPSRTSGDRRRPPGRPKPQGDRRG